jgi:hypothetical protein
MKNEKRMLFFRLVCASFFSGALHAAQLHVPSDYSTIQAAINAANEGDTVLVSPGTYYENVDYRGKAISVASAAGANVTIIDGRHAAAVINFGNGEGRDSIIEGFTIQNGYSTWGSGISLFGTSPTILRNILRYNDEVHGYWGAAIGGWSSSPLIEGNLFEQNTGDDQYLTGVIAFVNSSSPLVANNIFVNNSCRAINMTLPVGNSPVVVNNTIVGNPVGIHVDARVNTSAQLYFNNILYANGVGLEVVFGYPQNNPTWAYNFVAEGQPYSGIVDQTGTNGNISGNPLFVNFTEGDFHLQPSSPCVDGGFNGAPLLPATDFDGNPRIIAGHTNGSATVDMGAYELNPTNQVTVNPHVICSDAQNVECGNPAAVIAQVSEDDGAALSVVWTLNGTAVQTNQIPAGQPPTMTNVLFTAALPLGTNLVEVTVVNTSGNSGHCSTTVTVVDTTPPVFFGEWAVPAILWPPNHEMVTVTVGAVVNDDCSSATWKIIDVQSNETGTGHTAPDWTILGDHTVALRAERLGAGSGRVYSITLQAEDLAGNLSSPRTVTVIAPKSLGK